MPKRFALTGAAGYIAPRHMKAIRDTGNELVAACDPSDSVGILDQYSYDISFFREFERFDRHLDKIKRKGVPIDYLSICSPNYLHDAHIRLALRLGADAICEKPLVINPWNIDALQELESETGKKIYTVLQLRVHPALRALQEKYSSETPRRKHEVVLTYITSRGSWYLNSWKGNVERSGGLATNIGIHFFDLLIWLFGKIESVEVHHSEPTKVAGYLELEYASVKWYLSIDNKDLPQSAREKGKMTFRSIDIDGNEVEFTEGFTDLHTEVYRDILAGKGFSAEDARQSIVCANMIRNAVPIGETNRSHQYLRK
jgi:UDP-N-acetyl-2-amino-2-deoxyglucuronate dehydrogenase